MNEILLKRQKNFRMLKICISYLVSHELSLNQRSTSTIFAVKRKHSKDASKATGYDTCGQNDMKERIMICGAVPL